MTEFEDRLQAWGERSKKGEVCGFLECYEKPSSKCPMCGSSYCYDHFKIHIHSFKPLTEQELQEKWKRLV